MADSELILRDHRGPITRLTLNRPDRRNALGRAMVNELSDVLAQLASDSRVRVLIITGAGTSFCAGMDLKESAELHALGLLEADHRAVADARAIAELIDRLHRFPRFTIAQINGPAYGGGAGLAMACDGLIMSDRARLGYPEVLRGLVAAIVLPDLVRQIGERRARTLVLTGQLLTANEAMRWGIVNQVCTDDQLDAAAWAVAERALEAAPEAVAITKRLLDEAGQRPPDLYGAAALSASIRVSREAREGHAAFLEKRRPDWAVDLPSMEN
jgi:methylglutaconyl-CoA hydratase